MKTKEEEEEFLKVNSGLEPRDGQREKMQASKQASERRRIAAKGKKDLTKQKVTN